MKDKYWMIQDIIDGNGITDDTIKDAMHLCYFRGLSHSGDKARIITEEMDRSTKELQSLEL